MKAFLYLSIASLVAAAPHLIGEALQKHESPDKPGLSAYADLDLTKLVADYGPAITKALTPDITRWLVNSFLPAAKVGGNAPLTPRIKREARRSLIKYGPFEFLGQGQGRPAAMNDGGAMNMESMDPSGQAIVFQIDQPLCGDSCTVLAGQIGIMSEDGQRLGPKEGMYVHHLNSFDASKPMALPVSYCGTDDLSKPSIPKLILPGSIFIGRGEDYGDEPTMFMSKAGNYVSGYHLSKEHQLVVQGDMVNYSTQTRKVFVTIDIEYLEGIDGMDATASLLSVIGCKLNSPEYNSTGPATTLSQKYPVNVNGTFIMAKGHMHNGGDAMIMRVNGKQVCVSKAIYDRDDLVDMSTCDMDLRVREGDWVEVESIYDGAKHPLRKDAMGMGNAHDTMGGMDLMGDFGFTFAIAES